MSERIRCSYDDALYKPTYTLCAYRRVIHSFHCTVFTSSPVWVRSIWISVCVSACLIVCFSVRSHISITIHPNFTKFSVHVTWQQCNRPIRYVLNSLYGWRQISPQLWFPVDLIMPTQFFTARHRGSWFICSAFKIQSKGLYHSSHHYPHGLPVKWQIQFKLASLTYKVLHTGTPSNLSERLHPYIPSRTLRSSSSANLYVSRTNLHIGSRSFHFAAPTVWNSLPYTLRFSQTLNTFREHLKTNLFQSAFGSP